MKPFTVEQQERFDRLTTAAQSTAKGICELLERAKTPDDDRASNVSCACSWANILAEYLTELRELTQMTK